MNKKRGKGKEGEWRAKERRKEEEKSKRRREKRKGKKRRKKRKKVRTDGNREPTGQKKQAHGDIGVMNTQTKR